MQACSVKSGPEFDNELANVLAGKEHTKGVGGSIEPLDNSLSILRHARLACHLDCRIVSSERRQAESAWNMKNNQTTKRVKAASKAQSLPAGSSRYLRVA